MKNIQKSFKEMINIRGIYKKLEINKNTCLYYRKRVNDGKEVHVEKMTELLKKAGYIDLGWKKAE